MRIVVALGGNALLEGGERPDASVQARHVEAATASLARLAVDHELIVTHGNGPQVGVIAEESARDPNLSEPYPFDVLGAETQGMIGYLLLQGLENAMPGREVASLVCQTVVDPDDPAFSAPTKFVGPIYSKQQAARLVLEQGWPFRQDGEGWRRVVASPEPLAIVELASVEALIASGVTPICAGGGGIPVVRRPDGRLAGREAVIDKDLVAALLARDLKADALLLLTDVGAVMTGFGTASERPIGETTLAELRSLRLPAGSMGPKVEAICRFVEQGGAFAAIGRLDEAQLMLEGRAGTLLRAPVVAAPAVSKRTARRARAGRQPERLEATVSASPASIASPAPSERADGSGADSGSMEKYSSSSVAKWSKRTA